MSDLEAVIDSMTKLYLAEKKGTVSDLKKLVTASFHKNKPTKKISAYAVYVKTEMPNIKEMYPNMPHKERLSLIGKMYRERKTVPEVVPEVEPVEDRKRPRAVTVVETQERKRAREV